MSRAARDNKIARNDARKSGHRQGLKSQNGHPSGWPFCFLCFPLGGDLFAMAIAMQEQGERLRLRSAVNGRSCGRRAPGQGWLAGAKRQGRLLAETSNGAAIRAHRPTLCPLIASDIASFRPSQRKI
jgi:hypothetical protein